MNHCKTCKHYDPPSYEERKGLCVLLTTKENSNENYDDLAELVGDYGYGAQLLVAAEFGCVLHED